MGCASSKALIKSASVIEEFLIPLQKKGIDCEHILDSKKKTDHQFITILCTSNTLAKHLKEPESSKQTSPLTNNSEQPSSISNEAIEELEESATKIETINAWELLNGLEDDEETEELKERGCFNISLDPIKHCSESSRHEGSKQEGSTDKGQRKEMSTELTALKAQTFEFARTVSLRDWLKQGGPVMSDGSYMTPKFGSFEHQEGHGSKESSKENAFDPAIVAQLEQAMDLTVEEGHLLKQIVVKWESNAEGLLRVGIDDR